MGVGLRLRFVWKTGLGFMVKVQLGNGRHRHRNVCGMIPPTPDPTSQATIAAIEAVGVVRLFIDHLCFLLTVSGC